MENTTELSKTAIDSDFFKELGFTEVDDLFVKENEDFKWSFYVGETDEDLGTFIEYRRNGVLILTGYWHDRKDFLEDPSLR